MAQFLVQFDPPLPAAVQTDKAIDADKVDWRKVLAALPEDFDTRYVIGDTCAAYYPTSIMNVFEDLYEEWSLFCARKPHKMCLCGYPVLDVSFVGAQAFFFHSHEYALGNARKPLAGDYNAEEVERVLHTALRQVWSVIMEAAD